MRARGGVLIVACRRILVRESLFFAFIVIGPVAFVILILFIRGSAFALEIRYSMLRRRELGIPNSRVGYSR